MEEPGQEQPIESEIVPSIVAPPQEENERKSQYWERLRRLGRANGMNRRESYQWATERVAEMWVEPPPPEPEPDPEPEVAVEAIEPDADEDESEDEGDASLLADAPAAESLPMEILPPESPPLARERDEPTGVQGLSDLPESWPTLPPNASLTAEIQWVQANRLRVIVSGSEDSAIVDLSRALVPAPSHSAIGWLETSIRAYSKYCDIAAKATQNAEDEKEHVRRERMAIEEIRSLLAEMIG